MIDRILINREECEVRVAFLEEQTLVELHTEKFDEQTIVNNIYRGRVQDVVPGLQAAFIDVGLERNMFLHFMDIRPESLVLGAADQQDALRGAAKKGLPGRIERRGRRPRMDPSAGNVPAPVRKGDEIIVQVVKDEIGTKAPRVTTNLALAGRYLVLLPFPSQEGGVSRKIVPGQDRVRLKKLLSSLKSEDHGFIVRTAGLDQNEEAVHKDADSLERLWESILVKYKKLNGPGLIHNDHDLISRLVRDAFPSDFNEVICDDPTDAEEVRRQLVDHSSASADHVKVYEGLENVFEAYGVEKQIEKAMAHKYWLPSGGYLIIDENEALTAIDVNTGRFTGKKDQEKTSLKTNLEACEAIAQLIRMRDIGGIIVVDFIDMLSRTHQEKVSEELRRHLRHDRAKLAIGKIGDFGLMMLTRKRQRMSLHKQMHDECPYCQGAGYLLKNDEIFRRLKYEIKKLLVHDSTIAGIMVSAHPKTVEMLRGRYRNFILQLKTLYNCDIVFHEDPVRHLEDFLITPMKRPAQEALALPSGRIAPEQRIAPTADLPADFQGEVDDLPYEGFQDLETDARAEDEEDDDSETSAESWQSELLDDEDDEEDAEDSEEEFDADEDEEEDDDEQPVQPQQQRPAPVEVRRPVTPAPAPAPAGRHAFPIAVPPTGFAQGTRPDGRGRDRDWAGEDRKRREQRADQRNRPGGPAVPGNAPPSAQPPAAQGAGAQPGAEGAGSAEGRRRRRRRESSAERRARRRRVRLEEAAAAQAAAIAAGLDPNAIVDPAAAATPVEASAIAVASALPPAAVEPPVSPVVPAAGEAEEEDGDEQGGGRRRTRRGTRGGRMRRRRGEEGAEGEASGPVVPSAPAPVAAVPSAPLPVEKPKTVPASMIPKVDKVADPVSAPTARVTPPAVVAPPAPPTPPAPLPKIKLKVAPKSSVDSLIAGLLEQVAPTPVAPAPVAEVPPPAPAPVVEPVAVAEPIVEAPAASVAPEAKPAGRQRPQRPQRPQRTGKPTFEPQELTLALPVEEPAAPAPAPAPAKQTGRPRKQRQAPPAKAKAPAAKPAPKAAPAPAAAPAKSGRNNAQKAKAAQAPPPPPPAPEPVPAKPARGRKAPAKASAKESPKAAEKPIPAPEPPASKAPVVEEKGNRPARKPRPARTPRKGGAGESGSNA